ncbi:DUF2971 domain-containing protein [Sphingobium sp.]|uniref:DUF2971 domain-containing protein n=1 Tax=Sphingobium sp. TaxID=1912891 RepID=UPI0025EF3730|nr:DUF2971 domain-containing protein [Sphingobium sp.]
MGRKIYKYFSANVIEFVFTRPSICGIKCSFPKDYNDPYELFLGVDLTVTPDLLAAYRELVDELPQWPTSCFSASPVVAPMWAHYGDNHSGFVVEFDVDTVKSNFPNIVIMDVTYRTEPSPDIAGHLQRAVGTKKPRHAYFLQQAVLNTAYFSKDVAWSYEQECRLLDQEDYCETIGDHKILQVPINCCTAIIVGKGAAPTTISRTKDIAAESGISWFHALIGKSMAQPFLEAENGARAVFDGTEICPAVKVCKSCAEPVLSNSSLCPWCSISEDHALEAAQGNPLRMLENLGMLENYYRKLEDLARTQRTR